MRAAFLLALLAAVGAQALAVAAQASWLTAHGGPDNTREAPSIITPQNVDALQLAWKQPAHAAITGTPVHDGTALYFADWTGRVTAANLSDGKTRWSVNVGARVDSTLAIGRGIVLVADATANLTALDVATGNVTWRTWVEPLRGAHLWGSPALLDGRIYQGIASEQTDITYAGAQDFRGAVACLDEATGRILWKTHMQPEGAHGASVWSTPALYPALDLLYVGTGNAYGAPAGHLSDSLVALHMTDGSLAWRYQATAADAFNARGATGPDADFGASPILYDLSATHVVADGDKTGRFFAWDRETGHLLWQTTVDFVAPGAAPSEKEGFLGTAAYEDGVLFAPTTDRSMVHAIEAATGRILWSRELNQKPQTYGGRMFAPTSVTNGVVLQGNALGQLFALDARNGSVLHMWNVGGAIQGGVSLAGDTILVPDSGEVIWGAFGNVSAYRLAANGTRPIVTTPMATPPIAATPVGPTRETALPATPAPQVLPPIIVTDAPAAARDDSPTRALPAAGLWGVGSALSFAAAALGRRRTG